MRFTSLATILLIAAVSQTEAVEIMNKAHAQGLKAPHRVPKQLAQQKSHEVVCPDPSSYILIAPGVPEDMTAGSVTPSSLTYTWSAPESPGLSPVTYYYLYWDSGNGGDINTFLGETNSGTTTKTVTGLSGSTTYGFKVVARNAEDKGVGEKSDALYMTTEEEDPCAQMYSIVPQAPQNMTAEATTSSSLTYSWSAPECSGSSPVTYYYIYFDQGYGGRTNIYFSGTAETSYTIEGLYPAWPYVLNVVAKNSDGQVSVPSDLLTMTTDVEAPVIEQCSASSCQSCGCGSCNTCSCGDYCYEYCNNNYCGCSACYGQNPNPFTS